MAQPAIVVYHTYQQYEWATKYYVAQVEDANEVTAGLLVAAEQPLVSTSVVFNRWEGLNAAGHKFTEGVFTSTTGSAAGEIQPIKYALHIRLISQGPNRPSTKFIHGYTESMLLNGAATVGLTAAITEYGSDLAAAFVVTDSEGYGISGATLRQFSRRRRMRRIP